MIVCVSGNNKEAIYYEAKIISTLLFFEGLYLKKKNKYEKLIGTYTRGISWKTTEHAKKTIISFSRIMEFFPHSWEKYEFWARNKINVYFARSMTQQIGYIETAEARRDQMHLLK